AGLRTLTLSFAAPAGCLDSVTYDRTILVNQNGGIGGSSIINDGAIVVFDNAGTPTYANYGCQALVSSLFANAGNDIINCNAGSINLNATVTGNYSSISWGGGSGTFTNINALTTTYTPGVTDTGYFTLSFFATGDCGISSTSYINVYNSAVSPAAVLTAVGSTLYCSLASGTYTYSWTLDGTPTTGSFYIKNATSNGCYQVTITDAAGCSVQSNIVCITNAGINENPINISVQPNPASNYVLLQLNAATVIGKLSVSIKDVTGKEVMQHNDVVSALSYKTPLAIQSLAAGVYFIECVTANGTTILKFIKE
ncbi:MAG TPA: T9SS type A sorting domain-containing protein, partial [Bacteroidia bacterium]|nr:T9SS type A sorting domain-containing protein [Bacteroidia bacterium]